MSQPAALLILPIRKPGTSHKQAMDITALLLAQCLEDLSLAERIEQALCATGYRSLQTVEVLVNEQRVFLQGRVPSHYLKQLAQATAMATEDARLVCNDLEVVTDSADERN